MKKICIGLICAVSIVMLFAMCSRNTGTRRQPVRQADTLTVTNDFYDDADTYSLDQHSIQVTGEIANPVTVDFSKLPLRRVTVKEAVLENGKDVFVGAYTYEGYSLYDILNHVTLQKKNAEAFPPIIDLYVEVQNESGDIVKLSWGELFYPKYRHQIIIATRVTRIIPYKSKELWPLPTESRLVVGTDLITERNISSPSVIRVKTFTPHRTIVIEQGKDPLYSDKCVITWQGKTLATYTKNPPDLQKHDMKNIFYGRGRGIHGINTFTGVFLKDLLAKHFSITKTALKTGAFAIVADDGYRGMFTFGEVFNRNDFQEILLMCDPEATNNGIFRLYAGCDYFSDRAIKGISEIYYFEE